MLPYINTSYVQWSKNKKSVLYLYTDNSTQENEAAKMERTSPTVTTVKRFLNAFQHLQ